ncbi:MAG TPA: TadE/TadG family type IV pilus assembly protein [Chloroflexota bacterium]
MNLVINLRAHSRTGKARRGRAQAMVEFGLIALLFVLMLFGIADFGMLLNGWINVSTGSAAGARWAALGNYLDGTPGVYSQAKASAIVPGLSTSSIKMIVTYTSSSGSFATTNYCRGYGNHTSSYTVQVNGVTRTCAADPSGVDQPASPVTPAAGDSVQVMVLADTFEVITPLVRPFFGCSTTQAHCYVPLTSSTTMRYEGSAV